MNNPEHFHILYADDNEDACLLIITILEIVDIKVTIAKTIAEAWHLAQTESFDLYLLDCQFPEGNSLDLCRCLREYAPHTPILFYSADVYPTDIENALAAGADSYLTKPYLDDLAETVLRTIKLFKPTVVKSLRSFVGSQRRDNVRSSNCEFD